MGSTVNRNMHLVAEVIVLSEYKSTRMMWKGVQGSVWLCSDDGTGLQRGARTQLSNKLQGKRSSMRMRGSTMSAQSCLFIDLPHCAWGCARFLTRLQRDLARQRREPSRNRPHLAGKHALRCTHQVFLQLEPVGVTESDLG
jgi:hypothetical protein